jgi:hypothetical protein
LSSYQESKREKPRNASRHIPAYLSECTVPDSSLQTSSVSREKASQLNEHCPSAAFNVGDSRNCWQLERKNSVILHYQPARLSTPSEECMRCRLSFSRKRRLFRFALSYYSDSEHCNLLSTRELDSLQLYAQTPQHVSDRESVRGVCRYLTFTVHLPFRDEASKENRKERKREKRTKRERKENEKREREGIREKIKKRRKKSRKKEKKEKERERKRSG